MNRRRWAADGMSAGDIHGVRHPADEREVCERPDCGQELYRKGLCRDCYEASREDAASWGER